MYTGIYTHRHTHQPKHYINPLPIFQIFRRISLLGLILLYLSFLRARKLCIWWVITYSLETTGLGYKRKREGGIRVQPFLNLMMMWGNDKRFYKNDSWASTVKCLYYYSTTHVTHENVIFSQEVCLFSPCIKQFYEDKSSLAHTFLEFVFLLPACKLRY